MNIPSTTGFFNENIKERKKKKMKRFLTSKQLLFICLIFALGLVLSGTAQADISVEVLGQDTITQGNWPGTYGKCFFLIPQSREFWREVPFNGSNNVCYGGSLLNQGLLTWDVFMKNTPPKAFIWYFDPTYYYLKTDGGDQWNPCENTYLGATFDNDISPTNDPLTSVLNVNWTGSLNVEYYFLEEVVVCRTLRYVLSVNGVPKATGSICDFDGGKYLVFKINGLAGASTIKLDVYNDNSGVLTSCCQGQTPAQYAGVNVHLSGVFVDQCGSNGCTPGYWKQAQHFDSWNGYTTGQKFSEVFGRTIMITWSAPGGGKPTTVTNPTLLQALQANGGCLDALARHAVAALLNSANPNVSYQYATAEIITMVQNALDSGDCIAIEGAKDLLATANQRGCPLN